MTKEYYLPVSKHKENRVNARISKECALLVEEYFKDRPLPFQDMSIAIKPEIFIAEMYELWKNR